MARGLTPLLARVRRAPGFRRPGPVPVLGCAALVTTKALDAGTTLYALSRGGFREANPVAAAAFDAFGPAAGAAALSALVVCLLVVAAEGGRLAIERTADDPGRTAYAPALLAYGVPSAVFLAAALHNAALLTG